MAPPKAYVNSSTNSTGCTVASTSSVGTRTSRRRFRPVMLPMLASAGVSPPGWAARPRAAAVVRSPLCGLPGW
jgi:hypothetical protein